MTKPLSMTETAIRLTQLCRGIAQDVATREIMGTEDKVWETGARILELLEGKTPDFPKTLFFPAPHPEDKAFHQKQDEPWFDCDVQASEGMAELFRARRETMDWPEPVAPCRAFTEDETRDAILRSVATNCDWWSTDPRPESDLERCEGAAFTILSSLDGTSLNLPMIDLTLDAWDIECRPELERQGFAPCVLDSVLKDHFHRVDPIEPTRPAADEMDAPGA